jgi:hypothetical protein
MPARREPGQIDPDAVPGERIRLPRQSRATSPVLRTIVVVAPAKGPVPGVDQQDGRQTMVNSAVIFPAAVFTYQALTSAANRSR